MPIVSIVECPRLIISGNLRNLKVYKGKPIGNTTMYRDVLQKESEDSGMGRAGGDSNDFQ